MQSYSLFLVTEVLNFLILSSSAVGDTDTNPAARIGRCPMEDQPESIKLNSYILVGTRYTCSSYF